MLRLRGSDGHAQNWMLSYSDSVAQMLTHSDSDTGMPRLGHLDENSKLDAHAQFLDLDAQLLRLRHWDAQCSDLETQKLIHWDACGSEAWTLRQMLTLDARMLGLWIVLLIY